jgi:hypothetical protein
LIEVEDGLPVGFSRIVGVTDRFFGIFPRVEMAAHDPDALSDALAKSEVDARLD